VITAGSDIYAEALPKMINSFSAGFDNGSCSSNVGSGGIDEFIKDALECVAWLSGTMLMEYGLGQCSDWKSD
jgi:hypothetical protein